MAEYPDFEKVCGYGSVTGRGIPGLLPGGGSAGAAGADEGVVSGWNCIQKCGKSTRKISVITVIEKKLPNAR